jgi:hypothetical protein
VHHGVIVTERHEEERFGEALMQIRDDAIHASDLSADGRFANAEDDPWAAVAASPEEVQQIVAAIIPEIVDQTLFELLLAADNAHLPLAWGTADSEWTPLDRLSDGSLQGSFMAFWREAFSKQRFRGLPDVDFDDPRFDLSDLDKD